MAYAPSTIRRALLTTSLLVVCRTTYVTADADVPVESDAPVLHLACSHEDAPSIDTRVFTLVHAVGETASRHGLQVLQDAALLERAYAPDVRCLVVRTTSAYFPGLGSRASLCPESREALGLIRGQSGTFLFEPGGGLGFAAPGMTLRLSERRTLLEKHGAVLVSGAGEAHDALRIGMSLDALDIVDVRSGEPVDASRLHADYVVYFVNRCAPCSARLHRQNVWRLMRFAVARGESVVFVHATPPETDAIDGFGATDAPHFVVADPVARLLALEWPNATGDGGARVFHVVDGRVDDVVPLDDAIAVHLGLDDGS